MSLRRRTMRACSPLASWPPSSSKFTGEKASPIMTEASALCVQISRRRSAPFSRASPRGCRGKDTGARRMAREAAAWRRRHPRQPACAEHGEAARRAVCVPCEPMRVARRTLACGRWRPWRSWVAVGKRARGTMTNASREQHTREGGRAGWVQRYDSARKKLRADYRVEAGEELGGCGKIGRGNASREQHGREGRVGAV